MKRRVGDDIKTEPQKIEEYISKEGAEVNDPMNSEKDTRIFNMSELTDVLDTILDPEEIKKQRNDIKNYSKVVDVDAKYEFKINQSLLHNNMKIPFEYFTIKDCTVIDDIAEEYDLENIAVVAVAAICETSSEEPLMIGSSFTDNYNYYLLGDDEDDSEIRKKQINGDVFCRAFSASEPIQIDIRGATLLNTVDHLSVFGGMTKETLQNGVLKTEKHTYVPDMLALATFYKQNHKRLKSRQFLKSDQVFDNNMKSIQMPHALFEELVDTVYLNNCESILYENYNKIYFIIALHPHNQFYNRNLNNEITVILTVQFKFFVWKKERPLATAYFSKTSNVYADNLYFESKDNKVMSISMEDLKSEFRHQQRLQKNTFVHTKKNKKKKPNAKKNKNKRNK